jgi:parvulin-like peptidyl-prolyl isomerase
MGVIALVGFMLAVLWWKSELEPPKSVVKARHILIAFDRADPSSRLRAFEKAKSIRKRILDGEDFGRLAKQYSSDPGSADVGGALPWSIKGTYATEFEELVWSAPIGKVNDPIQTIHGFHIVVVEGRIISDLERAAAAEERLIEERATGTQEQQPDESSE